MANGTIKGSDVYKGSVEITTTASDTYGSALNKIGNLLDFSKLRPQTIISIAGQYYNITYYDPTQLVGTKVTIQATKVKIDTAAIKKSNSAFGGIENSFTIYDVSSSLIGAGVKIQVIY